MRQDAQGWCTGMTQKDGMGREVGGGFRMGNTCKSMADSCQYMAKPLQYFKVISLQLKKKTIIFSCKSMKSLPYMGVMIILGNNHLLSVCI